MKKYNPVLSVDLPSLNNRLIDKTRHAGREQLVVKALIERLKMGKFLLSGILCLVALWMSACDRRSDIKTTVPANGETDISTTTDIIIRFSDNFLEGDDTSPEILEAAVTVSGDLHGRYTGSVEVNTFGMALQGISAPVPVMPVDNTPPSTNEGDSTNEDDSSGSNDDSSTDDSGGTEPDPVETTPTSIRTSTRFQDTLVFSLPTGTHFQPGERITVNVNNLTIGNLPINSYNFHFTIQSFFEGQPRVTEIEPVPAAIGVEARPRVKAAFSVAVDSTTIEGNITMRGDHSGTRSLDSVLFTKQESDGRILEVSVRPDRGSSFIDGEWVTVTFSNEILGFESAMVSTPSSQNTTGGLEGLLGLIGGSTSTNVLNLLPYTIRFQVQSGFVQGGWNANSSDTGSENLAVAAGNFLPDRKGVEYVVLTNNSLELYYQFEPGVWQSTRVNSFGMDGAGNEYQPVDVKAADLDGEGFVKILVLLASTEGSRIKIFAGVTDSLIETDKEDPLEIPATEPLGLAVLDIDSNGHLDLLIHHENMTYDYDPDPEKTTLVETGTLTLFEKSRSAPDLSDPLNLDALMGRLEFNRVENLIDGLTTPARLEFEDLDLDGKPDLILQTEDGIALYQNSGFLSGGNRTRFMFHLSRFLKSTDGDNFQALNWGSADLDADLDTDILAWGTGGTFFFRNSLNPNPSKPGNASMDHHGILVEDIVPERIAMTTENNVPLQGFVVSRQAPLFADFDGDLKLDVAIPEDFGTLSLFQVIQELVENEEVIQPMKLQRFSFLQTQIDGTLIDSTIMDANGDTGMDFVFIAGERNAENVENLSLILATDVQSPEVVISSSFKIDLECSTSTDTTATVIVVGNLAQSYSGYRLTLDYDETLFNFTSFIEPPNFSQNASVSVCSDTQGCGEFVSVDVSFQNTTGAPGEDILLGTFHFSKNVVEEPDQAEIFLANGLVGGSSNEKSNTVNIFEAGASVDAEVGLEGEPFIVTFLPPALPLLEIAECSITEVLDSEISAMVAWRSPADVIFASFEVEIKDSITEVPEIIVLGPADSDYAFTFRGAEANVTVTGKGLAGEDIASVGCTISGVFRPRVTCNHNLSANQNLIEWTIQTPVNGFNIYKNGGFRSSTSPTATSFTDFNPSIGGDVYEVAGRVNVNNVSTEGPRGACENGPVGDQNSQETDAPGSLLPSLQVRPDPSSPNILHFTWRNGEGYDELVLKLFREVEDDDGVISVLVHEETFTSPTIRSVYEGILDEGGVEPGNYKFSVQGFIDDRASDEVNSFVISVPLPILQVSFTCQPRNGNGVFLSWDMPWQGYDDLTLTSTVRDEAGNIKEGPSEAGLLMEGVDLSFENLAETGVYEFTLTASYTKELPFDLQNNLNFLTRTCTVEFRPSLKLEVVETGVGLRNVLIPIRGDLFGELTGFTVAIDLPEVYQVDPSLDNEGKPVSIHINNKDAVIDDGFALPDGDDRIIRFSVSNANFSPGEDIILAWISGSIPEDFSLEEAHELRFSGDMFHTYRDSSGDTSGDPVAVFKNDSNGRLLIRKRFMSLDSATAIGGSGQPVVVRTYLTFDPVPPAEGRAYGLWAFTVQLKWDPALLELQDPISLDQLETVVAGEGTLFLPLPGAIQTARQNGNIDVTWFGLLPDPVNPVIIESGFNMPLLVLKFLPLVPQMPTGDTALIEFVTLENGGTGNLTQVVPTFLPPDGPPLETTFGGAIEIKPSSEIPALLEIEPNTGSLIGGSDVMLTGINMLSGVNDFFRDVKIEFVRRLPGQVPIKRLVTDFDTDISDNLLKFTVPSAGSEFYKPVFASERFDVELTTPKGRDVLVAGYRYDYLRLRSMDVSSGSAAGGDRVEITGSGISQNAKVNFHVVNVEQPFQATVEEISQDGTRIVLVTPPMPGQEGKVASIEVVVPIPAEEVEEAGVSQLTDRLSPFLISGSSEVLFIRGDVNGDGAVNSTDAGILLNFLRMEDPRKIDGKNGNQPCDAYDVNDDGFVTSLDGEKLFKDIFENSLSTIPAPYPNKGVDPTSDDLGVNGECPSS